MIFALHTNAEGHIDRIDADDFAALRLVAGDDANEKYADLLVEMLNRYAGMEQKARDAGLMLDYESTLP